MCGFLIFSLFIYMSTDGAFTQEKKAPPKVNGTQIQEDGPVKGRLPANWGKLGLTDKQKEAVYKITDKYNKEIAKLKKEITKLQSEQKSQLEGLLTPEQKKRLIEIRTGGASK